MTVRPTRAQRLFWAGLGAALWSASSPALAQPSPSPQPSAAALAVQVAAGIGLGDRSLARPIADGQQRIEPGLFPAASLGIRVIALPDSTLSWQFLLAYQTTIYDTVWEHPPIAEPNEVRVRSHHVELGVEPVWRADTAGSVSLGFAVGYSMRVFWPDVHNLRTPRQLLTGPFVRPEILLFSAGPVSVRAGPELFWILTLDPTLRNLIGPRHGYALGGQASLLVTLGSGYALELMYRESHAVLVQDFADVERFLTLLVTRRF